MDEQVLTHNDPLPGHPLRPYDPLHWPSAAMGTPGGKEKGYLAIVLHAHLPFVRHPEHEDFLEEYWLYEAITETYIPLLLLLEDLVKDGVNFRVTLSLTPPLVSMLLDPILQSRYLRRLERLIKLTEKEIQRTKSQPEFNALAVMYHNHFLQVRNAFLKRYNRNLVHAFRGLQELGCVEIIASAATHGYLPLLSINPSAIRTQIQVGVEHYKQVFGRNPKGFWLPECGYYPGLDQFLREQDIRYTILETHGITRATPRPLCGVYAPLYCPSGMAAFGRDPESSKQVWSSKEGYPGDYDYREFYRDIAHDLDLDYIRPYIHRDGIRIDTGIKYYRITGKGDHKEVYVPEWAKSKAETHAGNFLFNREKQIEYLASVMDRKPVVIAPYDAELFGHWWFEGPIWLNFLIRKITFEQKTIRLITLSEYLEEYPLNQVATPSMSSWGHKGFNEVWLNGSNDWIYRHLHRAAELMGKLVREHSQAKGLEKRALKQATRELLLAQASDWAFIINSGTMVDYAVRRTRTHLLRLYKLCRQIESHKIDEGWLSMLEYQDNIFPEIKYHYEDCKKNDKKDPGPQDKRAKLKPTKIPLTHPSPTPTPKTSSGQALSLPLRPIALASGRNGYPGGKKGGGEGRGEGDLIGEGVALHVAMAAPEITPFAKTGGLADMVGSLALALEQIDQLGVKVTLIMPAYRSVLQGSHHLEETGLSISVPVSNQKEEGSVLKTKMGQNITVYFIRADRYFDRDHLYTTPDGDYPDNARRFVYFSRAVLEILKADPPHLLHTHDWQSALSTVFMKTQPFLYEDLSSVRTVLTVHNLGYQGLFRFMDWPLLNLGMDFFTPRYLEFYGKINLLKGGIVFADTITTVSPTYAEEIKTPEQGVGLEGVFQERADDLVGILNGVDYSAWNPESDPYIAKTYNPQDLSGKNACKADLQRSFGLPNKLDIPLIGMVSRLTSQKGVDLIEKAFNALMRRDIQFILLGSGDRRYQDFFNTLPARYPKKVAVRIAFDEVLAHKIEAGADLFLMPSRYEPGGLNQLYSLKYGTIPIVRTTGGLKDTVMEFDPKTGKGNGFVFGLYEADALLQAVDRAIALYHQKEKWSILIKNAMAADYSWDRSARLYIDLYHKLIRRCMAQEQR